MGSYHSLWVTDPYDLEIGSSNAAISRHLHTHTSKLYTGAAKGARGSHVARTVPTPAKAVRCPPLRRRASDEVTRKQCSVSRSARIRDAHDMCMGLCIRQWRPLSALLGLARRHFGTRSTILFRFPRKAAVCSIRWVHITPCGSQTHTTWR